MKNLFFALLLMPVHVMAQFTDISINGGVNLLSTRSNRNAPPERSARPIFNIEAVRHTKSVLFYGVQVGYSSLAAGGTVAITDMNANKIGEQKYLMFYGKHSINTSLTAGVSFGTAKNLFSFGAIGGVVFNSAIGNTDTTGNVIRYYTQDNKGYVIGIKANYQRTITGRLAAGVSIQPQRYKIYLPNANPFIYGAYTERVFLSLPVTIGIHYKI